MLSETIVVSDRFLTDPDAWLAAISREKFPLVIALDGRGTGTIHIRGHLHAEPVAIVATLGEEPLEPRLSQARSYRLTLRSNDLPSSIAAGITALAFAKTTDGALYAGPDMSPSVDFELVRQSLVAALVAQDASVLPARSVPQRRGPQEPGPNRVTLRLMK